VLDDEYMFNRAIFGHIGVGCVAHRGLPAFLATSADVPFRKSRNPALSAEEIGAL
jgi:hypothetical protein